MSNGTAGLVVPIPKFEPVKTKLASPSRVPAEPEPVITLLSALLLIVVPAESSNAGGEPAPVEVNTCPSEPVAIATGLPDAS